MMRVDFIVNAQGVPLVLEGNNLPGFTATSLVPKAAAAAGISFERLTSSMIRAALLRRAENPAGTALEPYRESGSKINPLLLTANIWLMRLILLLNAAILVFMGYGLIYSGIAAWPLFVSAALLLVTEPVLFWLRSLKK